VHDALVAVAALEHDAVLVSRDRRAVQIYQRFRVQVELLP
jgi:predicted nucleic acid-binding protein